MTRIARMNRRRGAEAQRPQSTRPPGLRPAGVEAMKVNSKDAEAPDPRLSI